MADNNDKFMSPGRVARIMDALKLNNDRFSRLFNGLEKSELCDIGINSLVCEILNQRGYRIVDYPIRFFEDKRETSVDMLCKQGKKYVEISQDEFQQKYEQCLSKNREDAKQRLYNTLREYEIVSLEREKIIFIAAKQRTLKYKISESHIVSGKYENGKPYKYTSLELHTSLYTPTIAALYLDVQSVRGAVSNSKEFCIEILTPAPDDAIYDYALPEEQNQLIKDMEEIAQAIGSKDRIRIQMTSSFTSVADHNKRSRIKEM